MKKFSLNRLGNETPPLFPTLEDAVKGLGQKFDMVDSDIYRWYQDVSLQSAEPTRSSLMHLQEHTTRHSEILQECKFRDIVAPYALLNALSLAYRFCMLVPAGTPSGRGITIYIQEIATVIEDDRPKKRNTALYIFRDKADQLCINIHPTSECFGFEFGGGVLVPSA